MRWTWKSSDNGWRSFWLMGETKPDDRSSDGVFIRAGDFGGGFLGILRGPGWRLTGCPGIIRGIDERVGW